MVKRLLTFLAKLEYFFIFFFIFFIPRVIKLGKDVYAVDAYLWDARSDRFVEAVLTGNFIETNQKYHPGVTLMWLSGFSKKLYRILFELKSGYSPLIDKGIVYPEQFFVNLFVAKLPLVLLISTLLALSLFLLYKLKFDRNFLLIFAILLSLEPFFLGVTRFFHLTGLEATTGFTAVILAYYYAKTFKYWVLILSGLVLALGVLSKISVLVFLPFIGLLLFFTLYIDSKKDSFIIKEIDFGLYTDFIVYVYVYIYFISRSMG